MLKIGLTGGIGCGKSTAVDAFRDLGVKIIDADMIARDVVKAGSEALTEIVSLFGDKILLESGELDRAKLKNIIFAKSKAGKKALADLENITHPKIRSEIKSQMSLVDAKESEYPYLIIDIPLLVEKNYQTLFDRIVVVDCLVTQQLDRVKKRDELDEATILKIIQQQATPNERKNIATDILDNNGDINSLLSQVKLLHQKFEGLSKR